MDRGLAEQRLLRLQIEQVHRAALVIGGAKGVRDTLQTIVEQARGVAGARCAAFELSGAGDEAASSGAWFYDGVAAEQGQLFRVFLREAGAPSMASRAGHALRIRDVSQDTRFSGVSAGGAPVSSLLIAPLYAEGGIAGTLYLADGRGAGEFSEQDQYAIELLAQHAGLALERAWIQSRFEQDFRDLTQAQEALRLSRERFRLTLDNAPIGMALVGLDGRFLRVNAALAELLHYTPDELVALRFQDITHPEDLDTDLALAEKLRKGEIPRYRLEKRYFRKDGAVVDIVLHGSVIRDERGNPIHFIAQIEDITERKRAYEALRRSEAQFRSLIEHGPDGIFVHRGGVFLYLNPAMAASLGYRHAQELLGKPVMDLVHPMDRKLVEERIRMVTRRRSPTPLNFIRFLRRDGSVLESEVAGLMVDFDGQPSVLVVSRDLTARRQAERERERLLAAIDAERRRLELVVDRAPTGIALAERRDGNLSIRPNVRAEEIIGPRGATGEPWPPPGRIFDPDGRPLSLDELPTLRALRGEVVSGEDLVVHRPDGRKIPIRANAAPIRDVSGQIVGAVGAFEDVSALKEVDRLRQEWTSVVAHDLRQPIQVISLATQMLARLRAEPHPEKEAKAFERIRTAAARLDRMINDLLDASRLEARRLEIVRREVELPSLLREVIEHLAHLTEGRRVLVEQRGLRGPIQVDPDRIEQVLENLLSNAVKYGQPGTDIRVELEGRDGEVEVAVVNRGQGIPPEEIDNLFHRFARTQAAEASGVTGLGLGLYISKGLVEAHGGRIWAESTPGETTRFHFTLPRAPAQPRSVGEQPPAPPPA